MKQHYLDNSATSRVLPLVAEKAKEVMLEEFGNPSSMHELGQRANKLLEQSRKSVADAMHAAQDEITFFSCGTEAANVAIFGACLKKRHVGHHIITTYVEHAATLRCVERMAQDGWDVTYIPVDETGNINPTDFEHALREDTVLVACMLVNNEVGTIFPIAEMGKILKKKQSKALFYVDAVQALARVPLYPAEWGVDLMSVSGHKIGAPKGIGALYIRRGLMLQPQILGGGQETGLRSGTQSLPLIAAFALACDLRMNDFETNTAHVTALRKYLDVNMKKRFPKAIQNGGENSVPHVVNYSLLGCKSEVMLRILSDKNVYISAGSSCSKGKPSHVLRAMNLEKGRIDSALRISMCPENTIEDIDALLEALEIGAARFLKIGDKK